MSIQQNTGAEELGAIQWCRNVPSTLPERNLYISEIQSVLALPSKGNHRDEKIGHHPSTKQNRCLWKFFSKKLDSKGLKEVRKQLGEKQKEKFQPITLRFNREFFSFYLFDAITTIERVKNSSVFGTFFKKPLKNLEMKSVCQQSGRDKPGSRISRRNDMLLPFFLRFWKIFWPAKLSDIANFTVFLKPLGYITNFWST